MRRRAGEARAHGRTQRAQNTRSASLGARHTHTHTRNRRAPAGALSQQARAPGRRRRRPRVPQQAQGRQHCRRQPRALARACRPCARSGSSARSVCPEQPSPSRACTCTCSSRRRRRRALKKKGVGGRLTHSVSWLARKTKIFPPSTTTFWARWLGAPCQGSLSCPARRRQRRCASPPRPASPA